MEYIDIFADEYTKKGGGEQLKPVFVKSKEMYKQLQKQKCKWIIVEDEDIFFQLQKSLEANNTAKKSMAKNVVIVGGGFLLCATPIGLAGLGTVGLLGSVGACVGMAGFLKDVIKSMLRNYYISLNYKEHTAILLSKKIDPQNDTICGVPFKYIISPLTDKKIDKLKIHTKKKERKNKGGKKW